MCLEKKSFIPRIALKDIVVYKSLEERDKELYTTVTRDFIELGKTYKGIFKKEIISNWSYMNSSNLLGSLFNKYVTSGYIHSFKSKERAHSWFGYTIVECIIPKGTLYFIGKNGNIASRKLKYVKIIER